MNAIEIRDARERLRLYRARHVIAAVRPEDFGWAPTLNPDDRVCRWCGIRVFRRKSGSLPLLWRHDMDEIRRLAATEYVNSPG